MRVQRPGGTERWALGEFAAVVQGIAPSLWQRPRICQQKGIWSCNTHSSAQCPAPFFKDAFLDSLTRHQLQHLKHERLFSVIIFLVKRDFLSCWSSHQSSSVDVPRGICSLSVLQAPAFGQHKPHQCDGSYCELGLCSFNTQEHVRSVRHLHKYFLP